MGPSTQPLPCPTSLTASLCQRSPPRLPDSHRRPQGHAFPMQETPVPGRKCRVAGSGMKSRTCDRKPFCFSFHPLVRTRRVAWVGNTGLLSDRSSQNNPRLGLSGGGPRAAPAGDAPDLCLCPRACGGQWDAEPALPLLDGRSRGLLCSPRQSPSQAVRSLHPGMLSHNPVPQTRGTLQGHRGSQLLLF